MKECKVSGLRLHGTIDFVHEKMEIKVDGDGDYFFTTPSLPTWIMVFKYRKQHLYKLLKDIISNGGLRYDYPYDQLNELVSEIRDHLMTFVDDNWVKTMKGTPIPYWFHFSK